MAIYKLSFTKKIGLSKSRIKKVLGMLAKYAP